MKSQVREQLEASVLRYGRKVTFFAALIYATAAVALRVPETLAMFALGIALVGPLVLRDVLWTIPPSILGDFASAVVAPLVVLLFAAVGGLPVGRVIAVSAGSALGLSTWFTLRRAFGLYG